jgi:hypothetical protein
LRCPLRELFGAQHDSADAVAALLREPDVAVRTGRNTAWLAVLGRDGEFGNRTVGGDPPDTAPHELAEPEIPVRADLDEKSAD